MNDSPSNHLEQADLSASVERLLSLLADGEIDTAIDMLDEDIEYTNVSLPTIRGRDRVRKLARATLGRSSAGFGVTTHTSAEGIGPDGVAVVLNERTDVLRFGPVHVHFWVFGHFEFRDGQISVWRDSFDWSNLTIGLVRGVVAAALGRPAR